MSSDLILVPLHNAVRGNMLDVQKTMTACDTVRGAAQITHAQLVGGVDSSISGVNAGQSFSAGDLSARGCPGRMRRGPCFPELRGARSSVGARSTRRTIWPHAGERRAAREL